MMARVARREFTRYSIQRGSANAGPFLREVIFQMELNLDRAFNFAVVTMREAGELLCDYWQRGVVAEYKGEIDLVTEADRASDRLILDRIRAAYPDHAILSEESGASVQTSRYQWIVDPLDGTTNFAHGYPIFSVTIALQVDEITELGVTYDPLRAELFTARRGQGARLNDRLIHVSKTPVLDQSLLATGFPYDRRTNPDNNVRQHYALLMKSHGVVRAGSAALDLASVASGRLDGYWEYHIKAWDSAAGVLMVNEAGGCATNPAGDRLASWASNVVASNSLIHAEMLAALQSA
jgi:myo-inositol-1(or 4)-monophosphatase